ncbi:MAG: dTDP-glucose 4,6-dehydratase [Cyclobacteriaceae bacterium]|nr:dTDP-glucose 4,6-dehydratase [Cyclobacteriaceae bacterium]
MTTVKRSILITGGAGFIGSHLVRHFVTRYPNYQIINLDNLTYAGNLENLKDIEAADNYTFVKGSITDLTLLRTLFKNFDVDGVLHTAAESHVDRSIENPMVFVQTNVQGTAALLQVARECWTKPGRNYRFHHISTDEVFGALGEEGYFTEQSPYNPQSPYAASKASADHLVRAFHNTYKLPVVLSNCSNNYGPYQFPEKLIPLFIKNILEERVLPVYGTGCNVRDWLHVQDHVEALDLIFHEGKTGDAYLIGGHNEWKNIDLIHLLCQQTDKRLNRAAGHSQKLIHFVQDRAGHDHRYAIDASYIKRELGWTPRFTFEQGLAQTIDWYLNNSDWIAGVSSGAYRNYYLSKAHTARQNVKSYESAA